METLPHPRDFMGPKWQDRVWSSGYKIWSLQDEMLCVKIICYLKCEKVTYLYGGIRLWVFICKTINYIHKKGINGKVETCVIDTN